MHERSIAQDGVVRCNDSDIPAYTTKWRRMHIRTRLLSLVRLMPRAGAHMEDVFVHMYDPCTIRDVSVS